MALLRTGSPSGIGHISVKPAPGPQRWLHAKRRIREGKNRGNTHV
ncbi:hypothetical protein [uncultured Methanoregula sp.]|nr:hypothetical protein [uncultured Methanoregula sp.]